MSKVIVVNQQKGRHKAAGKILAEAISKEVEIIARHEAAKNGFNVSKEPHGLMRAMMHVLQRPELLKEAARLARERLEKEGQLPKEDPKVVKHRNKIL